MNDYKNYILIFSVAFFAGWFLKDIANHSDEVKVASNEIVDSELTSHYESQEYQDNSEIISDNGVGHSLVTPTFSEGQEYSYFSDGSCTENCLTKDAAMQACNNVKGYTTSLKKVLAVVASNKNKALLEGGDVINFSTAWTGSKCYASLAIKGIYEGSSASTEISGSASTFVYINGEILVKYIDTMG